MSVTDKLAAYLSRALGDKTITLFTANGVETVLLSEFAPSIASVLARFVQENQRMPAMIFNDGIPPSFVARLRAKPMFNEVVRWEQFYQGEINVNYESGASTSDWLSTPVLNVKMLDTNGDVHNTRFRDGTQIPGDNVDGTTWQVQAGSFQTWGIMLAAYSSPDYCFATDEGIVLTAAGVELIERSLPYWFEQYMKPEHWFPAALNGPVTLGMPLELVDALKKNVLNRRKADPGFFVTLLGIGMSFAGFAFGASAFSSLIAGSLTPSTIAGSFSFAKQFGLTENTNALMGGLKIASLLGGDFSSLTSSSGLMDTGGTMADEFNWGSDPAAFDVGADIGITSPSIDYGAMSETMSDVNFTAQDIAQMTGAASDVQLADPAQDAAFQQDTITAVSNADASSSQEVFRQAEILAQNAEVVGPVSETQFGALTKASPQVISAARAAMGSSAGRIASANTAQAGAVRAQQQAAAATDPQEATVWSTAAHLLNLYGQYQANEAVIARTKGGALPKTPQLPISTRGSFVRQPDGSFTVRNADGTVTTVGPNGQVMKTNGNILSDLPAFVQSKTFMYIAGGAVLLGVTYAMFGKRRH